MTSFFNYCRNMKDMKDCGEGCQRSKRLELLVFFSLRQSCVVSFIFIEFSGNLNFSSRKYWFLLQKFVRLLVCEFCCSKKLLFFISAPLLSLSAVSFICMSEQRCCQAPPPPPLSLTYPSHDKSDLRSSVIQNTDTIWSATHSEHIQSVSWKLKIFPY